MEQQQSVLHPAGSPAESIATLSWIMFGGGAVIFLGVAALAVLATSGSDTLRRGIAGGGFIFWGGVIFPLVTVTALLVYGLVLTHDRGRASASGALLIEVSGEQWWWRIRYPDSGFATANEIRVPIERDIEITLSSRDVIHSFWVPSLAGKVDMIPGLVNRIRLRVAEPGVYRGQCAEYCGGPHALMALHVIALEPAQFEDWLSRQRQPATVPMTPLHQRGQSLFQSTGCNGCHTIRGTAASGVIGPDLTHAGSRISIAAATLPNTPENFSRWIRDNQHIKPNNRMPPFETLSDGELAALGAYLASLQ